MKVLLTQPLPSLVTEPPRLPDLGLGYLAASLRAAGHEVLLRDWDMPPQATRLQEDAREFAPGLIGLKCFTKDVAAGQATALLLREALPGAPLILGGPHASCAEPDEVMADFPHIDYAFRGEAEHALPALADLLASQPAGKAPDNAALAAIPGLVWRDADDPRRVHANAQALIPDLDALPPPAWDLLHPERCRPFGMPGADLQGAAAPVVTTRGCPANCSFCAAWRVNGKRIRHRAPQAVVEEVRRLHVDHGVTTVMFMDNCFTSSPEHFLAICDGLAALDMNLVWDCCSYERLEHLTDDALARMHRAGCRMLHLGIESASPRIRRQLQKHCTLEGYRDVVARCRRHGIAPLAWFLIGFPGETLAEMKETIRFALGLGASQITVTPCFPLPGSRVYEDLKARHGLDRLPWDRFDTLRTPWPMHEGTTARRNRLLRLARLAATIQRRAPALGPLLGRLLGRGLFG